MQEKASNPYYDFMYGKYLLKDLFDITLHEDDYLERAYNIWQDIGNTATALHAIDFTIDSDRIVKLPCNVELVESVSEGKRWLDANGEGWTLFHADTLVTDPNRFLADAVIKNPGKVQTDNQKSQLHAEGQYLPYELKGVPGSYYLHFDEKFVGSYGVCIYRGICVDDDGNPLLTRKEANAIAYKMAFVDTQKKAFMGNPEAKQLLGYIKQEAERLMAAAKIAEHLTQNEWNRLLSAKTRHDRKVFWSSYKLAQ